MNDAEKTSPENTPLTPAAPEPKPVAAGQTAPETAGIISINDFAKVQLRVGQILTAERIEGSEKLLKLKVDLGEDREPRQILAGIAKYYAPEQLLGRKIAVVANLKPAKLMGQLSEGMLLAASDEHSLELLAVGSSLAPGAVIR